MTEKDKAPEVIQETAPEEMTHEEMVQWIDSQDYEELLRRWRFARVGDPFFQDRTGEHYSQAMTKKRIALKDKGLSASKNVGFDNPNPLAAAPRR